MFKSLSIIFFLLSMLNIYSQNVTIDSGAKMIVGEGVKVTIEGDLVLNSTESLKITNSSFVVKGTSSGSGKMTYTKTIPSKEWQFISSPVINQSVADFVASVDLVNGQGNHSDNQGLAYYDNSIPNWIVYNTVENSSYFTSNTVFKPGQGWVIQLEGSGDIDISFTGSFPGSNSVMTDFQNSNESKYNFIGNPYPSYIAGNTSTDTDNFLEDNKDSLTEKTLWIWNDGDGKYDVTNNASNAYYLAPAQGFFIKSQENLSFDKNLQSHKSTVSGQQKNSSSRPEIKLMITDGSSHKDTDIFYIEGTTTGFDNGYDSTIFYNGGKYFDIYTHLVSDSQGDDYGIQSLPNSDYETMVVPVGFNATSNTEIIISAAIANFPAGISVYLEDKDNTSFTLLEDATSYTTTLSEDINGIGRFYLHTTSSVLSTDKVALNNHLSIYTSSKENIRISGVYSGVAKLRMYNILGKQVLNTSFEGNGLNDIALPNNISSGVYIVHLATESKIVTKKILI
jgi:hypothetical protein